MSVQLMYLIALLLPLWSTACADDEPMVVRAHFTEQDWKEWRGESDALDAVPTPPEPVELVQEEPALEPQAADPEPAAEPKENREPTQFRIELNSATLEDLVRLPGVGPSLGQRILDYRERRRFKRVRDLRRVRGIGAGKFKKIKDLVRVALD